MFPVLSAGTGWQRAFTHKKDIGLHMWHEAGTERKHSLLEMAQFALSKRS